MTRFDSGKRVSWLCASAVVAFMVVLLIGVLVQGAPGISYGKYELSPRQAEGLLLAAERSGELGLRIFDMNDPDLFRWEFVFVEVQGQTAVLKIKNVLLGLYLTAKHEPEGDVGLEAEIMTPGDTSQHWMFYGLWSGYRELCTPYRTGTLPEYNLAFDSGNGVTMRRFLKTTDRHWKLTLAESVTQDTGVDWQPESTSPNFGAVADSHHLGVTGLAINDLDGNNMQDLIVGWELDGQLSYYLGWSLSNSGHPLDWSGQRKVFQLEPGPAYLGGVALGDIVDLGEQIENTPDRQDLIYFVVGPTRDTCGFVVAPDITEEGVCLGEARLYPYPSQSEGGWLPYDEFGEEGTWIEGVGFATCNVADVDNSIEARDENVDFVLFFVYRSIDWTTEDPAVRTKPDEARYVFMQRVNLGKWESSTKAWFDYPEWNPSVHEPVDPLPTAYVQGAAVDVYNVLGSDSPDLVFTFVDAQAVVRRPMYSIGFDLRANGISTYWSSWSDYPRTPNLGVDGSETTGVGVAVADLDGDGTAANPDPEFIYLHANLVPRPGRRGIGTDLTYGTLWTFP